MPVPRKPSKSLPSTTRPVSLPLAGAKRSKWPGTWNATGGFSTKGSDDIARIDGIATEFHLGDGAMAARIDHSHPANFPVRATRGGQYFSLSGIDFILVDVAHFADDRIELSRLVAAPRQVDQFPDLELGRGRRLQAAVYVVGVGNPLLGKKSGAINVGCGRRLETHEGHVDRRVDDTVRIGRERPSSTAGPRRRSPSPSSAVAITILFSSCYLRLPDCSGTAPAISLGRQGLQPKSNKRAGMGQGYEGV